MDKLPRKEDLLKAQQANQPPATKTEATSSGENPAVKNAKDAAIIAENENKMMEFEIKKKAQEEGYQTWEQAKADITKKGEEAEQVLEAARAEAVKMVEEREAYENDKEKVVLAWEKVKNREVEVNARLEKAMKIEETMKNSHGAYNTWKEELEGLVEFHKENIAPCVKALRQVSSVIYNWMDALNNNSKYDFVVLYNYIGKTMRAIDYYRERMPAKLSTDILPQEGEKEIPE